MAWQKKKPTKPLVYHQCLRKEAMEQWQAISKAKKIRKSGKIKGSKSAEAYHCQFCGRWHVGRKAK